MPPRMLERSRCRTSTTATRTPLRKTRSPLGFLVPPGPPCPRPRPGPGRILSIVCSTAGLAGEGVGLGTVRAGRSRAPDEWRAGRGVVVAASLAELCGPTEGVVELPIWLFWHPDRRFDLCEPGMLRWRYPTVLRGG